MEGRTPSIREGMLLAQRLFQWFYLLNGLEHGGLLTHTATLLYVLLMGLVQGVTEWPPVSRLEHLEIVQGHLGIRVPVFFDASLHSATLIVVLTAFRREATAVLKCLVKMDFHSDEWSMVLFIALGNIPTSVLALVLHGPFISLFNNLMVVGLALLLTVCFCM